MGRINKTIILQWRILKFLKPTNPIQQIQSNIDIPIGTYVEQVNDTKNIINPMTGITVKVEGFDEIIGVPYEFDDTGDHKIEAIWRAINGCLDGAPVQSGEMYTISVVESEDRALAATGLNLSDQIAAIAFLALALGFAIRRTVEQ